MGIVQAPRSGIVGIEVLGHVIEPPAEPREAGDAGAWTAVEKQLGCRLPADYKEFVKV